METLERQIPISGPEGLVELKKISVGFEENMFAAATSQVDYLRKISLKMLTLETKSQTNGVPNSLPLNTGGGSQQQTGSTQQQSQSSQMFLYQQQHLLNQKQQQLQGNTLSSIMQSHMQQQQPQPQQKKPMLSTQLQYTQQPHLQMSSGLQPSQSILPQTRPFVMQSYLGLQQNLQSSVAQSTPNVLQHNPQGVLRQPQQQSQQSMHQQAPVLHQQQHPVLPSRQQMNAPNLQPNQLIIGEQSNVSDMQQQQQQQQELLNLQNNIANMQQHLLGNNIPHQQQLGQQSNMSGLQKQQQQPMHSMPQQVFHSLKE
ncbi:hypothetical protein MKW98_014502 [Papaver atlanticum]|uniref:Mediator complex subunit 15 KIX domain-containing protein n=1 Tax=Papaver atlanticum TaxID=357466 RepID=A0AAD4SM36_9MAGN|nr:hypothetical protein MKW98_014502 [Papaver atlanticum]